MTPYTYIRDRYGLLVVVGERVKHTETGRIGMVCEPTTEAGGGHHVRVLFDGDTHALPCHPQALDYSGEPHPIFDSE